MVCQMACQMVCQMACQKIDIYTHNNFNDYMYSETASKIIKKHFLIIL